MMNYKKILSKQLDQITGKAIKDIEQERSVFLQVDEILLRGIKITELLIDDKSIAPEVQSFVVALQYASGLLVKAMDKRHRENLEIKKEIETEIEK